ncbi:MAG: hypothetical protein IJE76_04040 [Bacteroidales bacterium]|nr:hypothetical protein [Bacteroidales bacterium]
MATTKKGKKTSKPKKGSKPKKKSKKNNSMGFFGKFMLSILLLAILLIGVLIVVKNINLNNTLNNDVKTEVVVKNTNIDTDTDTKSTANSQKPTINSQKPKANSQQPIANSQKQKANSQKPKINSQESISGSWLSSEQGASLTIDNYGYRIDFFGVDASAPMTGMIIIEDNKISFISNGRDCKNEEGSYKITFNKKNIRLVCKKDDCTKRRNILEADWEWMEI